MRKFPADFSAAKETAKQTAKTISRRGFVIGLPLFAAGCMTASYDSMSDGGHMIPAVDMTAMDSSIQRTEVAWKGKEKPGTIVVKISERRLYLVEEGGNAVRYGVGVGRSPGANFRGEAVIGRKEKWPHWTPTENMKAAIPMYKRFAGGMEGGPDNPLGPRALYLYRGGRDTNFRLHGTIEPETIGQPVSSGCIRLFNQDIIDLYDRVPVGAKVVVIS